MASSPIQAILKKGTLSGTTTDTGWLMSSLDVSNIKIISAIIINRYSAVMPTNINNKWWFMIYGVDNNTKTIQLNKNLAVTIEYWYI